MWWLAAFVACDDDETHACDAGTPTCVSSLVLKMPDPRTEFEVLVSDEVGLDLQITCPNEDTGAHVEDGVTLTCGGGQVILDQLVPFGDVITVQLDGAQPQVYDPHWQPGADYCGNPCTRGTIQL